MYDTGKVLLGLIIFLAIVTIPFWYNQITGKATAELELEIITKAKQCVAETDYMRESHMKLLDTWRNSVVRDNLRLYEGVDGKMYNMSLTNTCLDCHSNKDKFCDRCHDYVSVSPTCWDCHVIPEETS